ncbi:hypothetical protein O7608_10165 [Solwaraspora sp. WMMA2056]|uniref:hypothetical protein n=1 Tax=Solwaraspora sp. WMMA2056 TaxID=3015161 RepID=UPI00259BD31E|nr:hypothetical protein [Solwaraspora sp. WMMA2056]WJK42704.1 hypothetical protein O7608_10165 [Solwaraspora sp. WMMA2056]
MTLTDGLDDLLDDDLLGADELGPEPAASVAVTHNDGQVAHTVYGGLHQYVQRVRDYHELSPDFVRDRLDGFVDPGYHTVGGDRLDGDGALTLLRRYGGAILVGGPGTGRYTAALRLLQGTGQQLREIRPTYDPARQEQLTVAELPVATGFAYLLELPEQAHHIQYGFARDLGAYCASLARRGSSVAVTVTEATWAQLGAVRDGPVLRVGVPPPGQVLGLRLRRLRPDLDLRWLVDDPQVVELLAAAAPAEAVRLAQLAADVLAVTVGPVAADSPAGKEVVAALLSAYHNWEAELTTWFHQHPDPHHRAFLVAAAALEGSRAGRVLAAAEALDARLTDPAQPAGLRRDGVRALVAAVDADLGPDHVVRFRRARYAEAVLDFVITDRADTFQTELWRWVADLPVRGDQQRSSVDRTLAARSAEMVLHTALRRRAPEVLGQVASPWSRRAELRATLVQILGIAALSPEIGAAVRQHLYRWAHSGGRPQLLITVAEVCGGQLADFYVEQAMVRLSHLARHGLVEVDDAVLAALAALWQRSRLRQPVLLRLAHWLAGDQPQRAALAARALERLGRPPGTGPAGDPAGGDADDTVGAPAATDDTAAGDTVGTAPLRVRRPDAVLTEVVDAAVAVQDDVGMALGRALDARQLPDGIETLLHRWFDDAAADPEIVGTLTHVLGRTVTAGPAAGRRVARLRALLAAWPTSDDPARQAVLRRHLVHQLHRADPITARRLSRPSQEL